MSQLEPGWIDRQRRRVAIDISVTPTFLLSPELRESRQSITASERIRAMLNFYIENYYQSKGIEMTDIDEEIIFTLLPLLNKYLKLEHPQ